jgi:hypothetical protein
LRTASSRTQCGPGQERCLELCYPTCRPGYIQNGCNVCALHLKTCGAAGIRIFLDDLRNISLLKIDDKNTKITFDNLTNLINIKGSLKYTSDKLVHIGGGFTPLLNPFSAPCKGSNNWKDHVTSRMLYTFPNIFFEMRRCDFEIYLPLEFIDSELTIKFNNSILDFFDTDFEARAQLGLTDLMLRILRSTISNIIGNILKRNFITNSLRNIANISFNIPQPITQKLIGTSAPNGNFPSTPNSIKNFKDVRYRIERNTLLRIYGATHSFILDNSVINYMVNSRITYINIQVECINSSIVKFIPSQSIRIRVANLRFNNRINIPLTLINPIPFSAGTEFQIRMIFTSFEGGNEYNFNAQPLIISSPEIDIYAQIF